MYEQFGGISVYDLKSGKTKAVAIRVQGDFPELRSKLVSAEKRLGAARYRRTAHAPCSRRGGTSSPFRRRRAMPAT